MGQDKNQESDSVSSETEDQNAQKKIDSSCIEVKRPTKKYKCTYPECNAVFLRPWRLVRHTYLHTGERPFKCTERGCEKAYTHSWHLKRHVQSHSDIKKVYRCPQCSLLISNQHNLKRHYERVHGDHRKLTCEECNLVFTKKHQLAEHIATHSTVIHKCDKCNKSFASMRKFKKHEESHSNRKSYPCTVAECAEVFDKWALLCVHLKTEHVKEYKCKDCDKVFLNKTRLKSHSKAHMDSALHCPYEDCDRLYRYKRNLDEHIQCYHIAKRFHCDTCDARLSSKQKLIEHIHRLHMGERKIRSTKKGQRRKRKDAGIPKRSMVSTLIGLNLPVTVEKMIIERKNGQDLEQIHNSLIVNGSI